MGRLKKFSEAGRDTDIPVLKTPRSPSDSETSDQAPSSRRRLRKLKEVNEQSVTSSLKKRKAVLDALVSRSAKKRQTPRTPVSSSDEDSFIVHSESESYASSHTSDIIASEEESGSEDAEFYSRVDLLMDAKTNENIADTLAPANSYSNYIEYLILLLTCNAEELVHANRQYSTTVNRIQKEMRTRAAAAGSTLWSNMGGGFKACLDSYPIANFDQNVNHGYRCAACFRANANAVIAFGGCPYDAGALWKNDPFEFFRATQLPRADGSREAKINDNDEYYAQLDDYLKTSEFSVSGLLTVHTTCAFNALKYHGIQHWKLRTMKEVYRYLLAQRGKWDTPAEAVDLFKEDDVAQDKFQDEYGNTILRNEKYLDRCEEISKKGIFKN